MSSYWLNTNRGRFAKHKEQKRKCRILKNIVDFMFRHENEIRQAILERKLDKGGRTGGNGSGHSNISDPTAQEAIRLAEEVEFITIEYMPGGGGMMQTYKVRKPERWLKVMAWTRQDLQKTERNIFDAHYVLGEKWYDTCERMAISDGTYYSVLKSARTYASGLAKGLGLIF